MPLNLTKKQLEALDPDVPLGVTIGKMMDSTNQSTSSIMQALEAVRDMVQKIDTIQRESSKDAVMELKEEMEEAMGKIAESLESAKVSQKENTVLMAAAIKSLESSITSASAKEEVANLTSALSSAVRVMMEPKQKKYSFRINRDGQGRMSNIQVTCDSDADRTSNNFLTIKSK